MEEAAVLGGGRPVAGVAIGADIVEVEGPHVIMICQPQALTGQILKAARAVAGSPRVDDNEHGTKEKRDRCGSCANRKC